MTAYRLFVIWKCGIIGDLSEDSESSEDADEGVNGVWLDRRL